MKKLFSIPVLAIVMGLAWTAISTPDANAKDHRRYDRHDRHDRHDRYDRDHDRRGHKWNRGDGKVHHDVPPGHKVKRHVRYRGHDHDEFDRSRVSSKYRKHRGQYDRHDHRDRRQWDGHRGRSLNQIFPRLGFAFEGEHKHY